MRIFSTLKPSQKTAVIIAVIALIWILSGFIFPSQKKTSQNGGIAYEQSETDSEKEKLFSVRTRILKAQDFTNDVIVTGRSRASQHVELKAETEGQIEQVLVKEGDHVQQNDILAKIELRDREARYIQARDRFAQREIEYNTAKSLERSGFSTTVRLKEAKADMEQARAELKQAKSDFDKTTIRAPFDGIINQQIIEVGDFVKEGDSALMLVNLDPVEFEGFVSERQINLVKEGLEAEVAFLDGKTIEAQVTFVASAADPDTRTFRVIVSSPNEKAEIKEGLTADLFIPGPQLKAHQVSPSILTLSDDGVVGVKIIDAQNKVRFKPVKIIADKPHHTWISGLPETAKIITVGQEFVIEGQKVNAVAATGDGFL